ncbi:Hypothetical predicted protein [Paramuricea clavata]|uniref:Uncharacterized protein n=1 Tax=Paramuricea clavata TaxID=317549 RepID=A0A6S7FV11_PARCT|nr:Hypothetical predicted protein [Paramuricea clavata]
MGLAIVDLRGDIKDGQPSEEASEGTRAIFLSFFNSIQDQRYHKHNRDRKLYDIEVVEVDRKVKQVKIHYVGYSKQYGEWWPYGNEEKYCPFIQSEKLVIATPESLEDRKQAFHGHLFREIKKKLRSMRRQDPDICIDLNTDQDVFEAGLGNMVPGRFYRGEMVYTPRSNRLLDSSLGQKWDERILNQNSDFAYVIVGTIRYWLGQRSSIVEFKYVGGQLIKSEIENNYFVNFQFVWG